VAGSFGYAYDPARIGLVARINLPNLAGISNHFDSLGRLDSTALVNYWGHTLDGAAYEYGIPDLRTKITRDLGLTTNTVDLAYDDIGQLTKWTGKEPGGAPRLNEKLGYGYDPAGNLQYRTNNALVQTFSVNNLNELSTVSRSGTFTVSGSLPAPATHVTVNGSTADRYSDLTFAKDSFNLTNGPNTFGIIASNVYGARATNNLTLNLPDPVSFQYDTNGNLTGDGTRVFVYDAENQLTNVFVPNQWKTEFVYDGFGRRRVSKDFTWQGTNWVKTNETRYVCDGLLPIQERDSNNSVQVTYTRGLDLAGSLQGAGGIGGLLAMTVPSTINSPPSTYYYHADGAGNVTAMLDAQQNIVARYLYDPYGRLISKSGALADVNRYQFSSKEIHPASGLYYYGFRFYDPSLQRWLNQDPIGEEGGINLYGFVGNSAENLIDFDGLDWHHLLAQAVFTPERLARWGLKDFDIHQAIYGWDIDPQTHTGKAGIHPSGWNSDWEAWAKKMDQRVARGQKIGVGDIECKLTSMKNKYKDFLSYGTQAKVDFKKRRRKTLVNTQKGGGAAAVLLLVTAVTSASAADANATELMQQLEDFVNHHGQPDQQALDAGLVGDKIKDITGNDALGDWAALQLEDK
jgi:RHS repeat-associated protein